MLVAMPPRTTWVSAAAAQLQIQVRAVEGAPLLLGDADVAGLPVELGYQLRPVGGRVAGVPRGLRTARGTARDVHQDDRQPARTERGGQPLAALDDLGRGHRGAGQPGDAFLKVDQYQGGRGVEGGGGHEVLLVR